LLFIDGNHQYEGALSDIVNLRPFANATYHRLIIDDGSDPNVRRAWVYAVETLRIVRLLHIERITESLCMNAEVVSNGPLAGSFEFKLAALLRRRCNSNLMISLLVSTFLKHR
jgi:hypothetical protein